MNTDRQATVQYT